MGGLGEYLLVVKADCVVESRGDRKSKELIAETRAQLKSQEQELEAPREEYVLLVSVRNVSQCY